MYCDCSINFNSHFHTKCFSPFNQKIDYNTKTESSNDFIKLNQEIKQ